MRNVFVSYDWISLAMYFAVSGLWIIIVKTKRFMGLKAESFLIAFNNNAPSLTIVSSLFFYTVVCTCTCRYISSMEMSSTELFLFKHSTK